MTLSEIADALRKNTPFEGSSYEQSAYDVYAAGLTSPHPGYESLDDALSDWRMEYEADIRDVAREISATSDPAVWLGGVS